MSVAGLLKSALVLVVLLFASSCSSSGATGAATSSGNIEAVRAFPRADGHDVVSIRF